MAARYKSIEATRRETTRIRTLQDSGLPEPLHGVIEDLVDIGVRQGASTHLKAVIDGSIEEVDHCVWIRIGLQQPLLNALPKKVYGHLSSGHRPPFANGGGEFGIKLGLREQRTNKHSVLSSERLRHGTHLQPNAFRVGFSGQEKGAWVHSRYERIHNDRGLVGPTAVDGHAANAGPSGDGVHAQSFEAALKHQVNRGFQDRLLNPRASWSAPSGRVRGLPPIFRFHNVFIKQIVNPSIPDGTGCTL